MAFIPNNFDVVVAGSTNNNVLDLSQVPQNMYRYRNLADSTATVTASGYFNYFAQNVSTVTSPRIRLLVGDWIFAACSDGMVQMQVATITPNVTVTTDVVPAGSITNADIASNAAIAFSKLAALPSAQVLVGSAANVPTAVAVSGDIAISNTGVASIAADSIVNNDVNSAAGIAYSKLAALPSASILVGNGSNVATATAMSGDVTISNAGVTTLSAQLIRYAFVVVSSTEVIAMYATPKELIAAPGAGYFIRIHDVAIGFNYAAQYTGGGNIQLQYDSVIHGAGSACSATISAATWNGITATSFLSMAGALATAASSTITNKGVYLSNDTGAFADGIAEHYFHIWYSVASTVI